MTADHQDTTLHNGANLHDAARLSSVDRSAGDALGGVWTAASIFLDIVTQRVCRRKPASYGIAVARGRASGSIDTVTALYAGTGSNRGWCFGSLFSHDVLIEEEFEGSLQEVMLRLQAITPKADLIITDGVGPEYRRALNTDFFCMPAWVKQRLRILSDWSSQIDALRRNTRQGLTRTLRNHGYFSRLTQTDADFNGFYDDLYKPHVSGRFGSDAIIVSRDQFLRECRRGIVLQILHNGEVIGASLLRRINWTISIVWTGMKPGTSNSKRGAADALDYFSLLYAFLKGCRWLDFGPSRPDLNDGAFRYKRKWGTMVTPGFAPQAEICWAWNGNTEAAAKLVQQHVFLSKHRGGYFATVFLDDGLAPTDIKHTLEGLLSPGIYKYRIIVTRPLDASQRDALASLDVCTEIVEAESTKAALAATCA